VTPKKPIRTGSPKSAGKARTPARPRPSSKPRSDKAISPYSTQNATRRGTNSFDKPQLVVREVPEREPGGPAGRAPSRPANFAPGRPVAAAPIRPSNRDSNQRPRLEKQTSYAKGPTRGPIRPRVDRVGRNDRTSHAARPVVLPEMAGPAAIVSRRASDKIRAGHLWVYQTDIEGLIGVSKDAENPPSLLPVADSRGIPLGTALYSPTSQITLRLISREIITEAAWLTLLQERLRTAIARRTSLLDKNNTAARLVFSEADELPGIILDRYENLLILQILARGLDNAQTRKAIVEVLRETPEITAIVERPDPRIRELESLSVPDLSPLYAATEDVALSTTFRLNGLLLNYDANAGQKTGAFLDQRENYAAAARYARGECLDICTYQGGFALHMAKTATKVTGVDVSRASLEVAESNLALNKKAIKSEVEWIQADAFELMRSYSDEGREYDTIVLDPPAFAKTQRAVENALRGYKELNLRALNMLRPGGTLITCSCSHHVSWQQLRETVAGAAVDAGRRVTLLEQRGASSDHPVILTLPETEYLKCLILRVD